MSLKQFSVIQELNQELRREMIRSFALGLGGISLIMAVASFFFFSEVFLRVVIIALFTVFSCGIALYFLHKNKPDAASYILVVFLWLSISGAVYTAGGLAAPAATGYLVIILLGFVLLGMRGGTLSIVICIASALLIYYAEIQGYLPPNFDYSDRAEIAVLIFFICAVFLIQSAAGNVIRETMAQGKQSEDRYRSLLENIPSITYINDLTYEARTLYVSPQVEKLLGYTNREFVDDPELWSKILFPLDQQRISESNRKSVDSGSPFNAEYRIVSKDGAVVWVRDDAILVRDGSGEPQYWLGVWTDITSMKNAEEDQSILVNTLVKRNNQLHTASEVSSAVNSILEMDELLNNVVELLRSHFGYYYVGIFLSDENKKYATLRAATGAAGLRQLEAGHSLEIGNSSMVGWCIANNQARIALDVGADAVRFKNPNLPLTRSELALPLQTRGQVIGAMTIQSDKPSAFSEADITSLQTMADQIANSIENARLFNERVLLVKQLEDRNAELERFSYTVSHDLKSPLVTIRGFLGYLKKDAHKGDLLAFDTDLKRIESATDKMQALLNDLLELSRIGRVMNSPEEVALKEIVHDALTLVIDPSRDSHVVISLQEDLPVVNVDRARMVEVYQNLIGNAVKFMGRQKEPRIEIGMKVGNGPQIFYVKDNGVGIDPAFHDRVFGLFNRLNPDVEGTGIGLSLVKRIVEVHGGEIWVESEGVDKGSSFCFTLSAS